MFHKHNPGLVFSYGPIWSEIGHQPWNRHDTQHKKTLIAENLNSWRKTVNPTIIWYFENYWSGQNRTCRTASYGHESAEQEAACHGYGVCACSAYRTRAQIVIILSMWVIIESLRAVAAPREGGGSRGTCPGCKTLCPGSWATVTLTI